MNVGEVYRDKDKRMSSGNRHVLVVATNGGHAGDRAVCVPCKSDGSRIFYDGRMTTTISAKTLAKRFQLVRAALARKES